jgi:hypothetical protein
MLDKVHSLETPLKPCSAQNHYFFFVQPNLYLFNFVKPNITFYFYLIIQHECIEPTLWVGTV